MESLDDVDAGNARALADDPERAPPTVEPFLGVEVPLSTLLAVELGEVVVHGYDIARAAGLPWRVEASDALTVFEEFLPLLPYLLDEKRSAGARVTAEIRARGRDPLVVRVQDGTLVTERAAGQKVDFTMSVDPAVYLLMSYNRIGPLGPMLRGRLMVWGRRPWKVATLQSVLST